MEELNEKKVNNKDKYISIAQKILLVIFGIYIIVFQYRHTLWLDELDWGIGIVDGRNLAEIYITVLKTGENLPLFYIVLYFARLIFGYNQMGLIFCTSIIFSFVGIIGLLKIARKFLSRRIEIIATVFIITSYAIIAHTCWQLRPYGMLFCFSTWSLYFYLKRLEDESWKNILKYGVCMIFLLYSHWFGSLIGLCYAFIDLILFLKKRVKMRCIVSYLICGGAFLPSFIILLVLHAGDVADYGINPPTLWTVYKAFRFIMGYVDINVIIFLVGTVFLIINSFRKKNDIYLNVIIYSMTMLLVAIIFYSKFINPAGSIIRDRYFITILPHAILVMACIVDKIFKRFSNKNILDVVVFITVILLAYMIATTYILSYLAPNSTGNVLYKERVDYFSKQEDIYSDDTLIICTFGRAWVKYYFTDQGIELPKNVIVIDPLKYPNTKHMSEVEWEEFEYCVKDGKMVQDLPVEDVTEYDTIYYMETYRVFSEEMYKELDEIYKVQKIIEEECLTKLEKNIN